MATADLASFLGRGWAFPVAASGLSDVAVAAADEDVRQAILLILETAPGERVMRPDFGCGLRRLVFAPVSSTTLALARKEVLDALVAWEPRIDVNEVAVTPHPVQPATVLVEVRYTVRSTNTFYNLVYPFDLQEHRP